MPFRLYDQNQSFLFPPHLSDWVTDDHPARVFSDLVDRLFAEVIVLARALGLVRLGLVALDGTKVRAGAGSESFKAVKE